MNETCGNELARFEKKPEKPMECTDFMEELIEKREGTVVEKATEIPDVRTTVIGAVAGLYRFDETQCWVVVTADGASQALTGAVLTGFPDREGLGATLWEREAECPDCTWLAVHYFTKPELSDKVDALARTLGEMKDPWMRIDVTTKTGRVEATNMDLVDVA